jgi:type IV secretion system protein TrbL
MRKNLYTAPLFFAALLLLMPAAHATGVMDTFVNSFQAAEQTWFGKAQGYANDLFYLLLALDFVWLALTWVLTRKTFDELLPTFIRKVLVYGFFLALLVNAGTWIPAIVNSFQQVGTNVSAVPPLTPSTLVDIGDSLAYGIVTGDYAGVAKYVPGATVPPAPATTTSGTSSGATCNWYVLCLNKAVDTVTMSVKEALNALMFFLISLIFAGITWVAFILMAFDLMITLIEAYVIMGVGVFFLGFGASRWTTKFADGVLNYAVSVGVKLMMLYIIIGVLINSVVPTVVGQLMVNTSSGNGVLPSLMMGGAGMILMLLLSKSIPSKAQSLLGGGASLGAAHAIREASGGAMAGGFIGSRAAAGMGVVAEGATGLAKGVANRFRGAAGGSVSEGAGSSAVNPPSDTAAAGMRNAGKTAGAGAEAAGKAAGAGVKAAGEAAGAGMQAAGAAVTAIPVPVVAQAAGAAISAAGAATSAAGQAAGAGIEAAGKVAGEAIEVAGNAAGKATETAGQAVEKIAEASGKSASGTADAAVKVPDTTDAIAKAAGPIPDQLGGSTTPVKAPETTEASGMAGQSGSATTTSTAGTQADAPVKAPQTTGAAGMTGQSAGSTTTTSTAGTAPESLAASNTSVQAPTTTDATGATSPSNSTAGTQADARTVTPASTQPAGSPSMKPVAPPKPAQQQNNGYSPASQLANAARQVVDHPGGSVQSSHVSTGHGHGE